MPVPKVKLWATWKLEERPLAKSAFPPSKTKLLRETSTIIRNFMMQHL